MRYYVEIIDEDDSYFMNFDDLMKALFRELSDRELICKNTSYTISEYPFHERS